MRKEARKVTVRLDRGGKCPRIISSRTHTDTSSTEL